MSGSQYFRLLRIPGLQAKTACSTTHQQASSRAVAAAATPTANRQLLQASGRCARWPSINFPDAFEALIGAGLGERWGVGVGRSAIGFPGAARPPLVIATH